MNNILTDLPDVPDLIGRLQRNANAQSVLLLGEEGEILSHSGQPGALGDAIVDAVADATAEMLKRGARAAEAAKNPQQPPSQPSPPAAPPSPPNAQSAEDDHVTQVGPIQICAAPLGTKAVLVVVFDEQSNLSLVRLCMKRAREQLLRNLEPA